MPEVTHQLEQCIAVVSLLLLLLLLLIYSLVVPVEVGKLYSLRLRGAAAAAAAGTLSEGLENLSENLSVGDDGVVADDAELLALLVGELVDRGVLPPLEAEFF